MPLHLACMGCVEDLPQFNRLVEAAGVAVRFAGAWFYGCNVSD
jgi:hypothetical protein